MYSEELPADLDKLKIAPKHEHIKLRDRNPFYSSTNTPNADNNGELDETKKQIIHSNLRRARRRSESNVDDFDIKQIDKIDDFETVNPLRCLSGVQKLQLKRSSVAPSKRSLLREPVLRIVHDNLHTKCLFGARIRRMLPLNLDEKSRTIFHAARSNISIKSSINGISSFRDLISECNTLLDGSKHRKGLVDNSWHSSKNFMIMQRGAAGGRGSTNECIEDGQGLNLRERPTITSNARLSCSQEASNNASNSRNCDDVTIVELASYFDTIVHIPKKMSSMAEMMYI